MVSLRVPLYLSFLVTIALACTPTLAGSHTWDFNELFSNAAGNIQFIELVEANGTAGETNVNGHFITSNANSFLIPGPPLIPPTSNRFLLFATADFAALDGAPTPDYIIPPNFFSIGGDTMNYTPWDTLFFPAGRLPINGTLSMDRGLAPGANSPTNYAGLSGNVNANLPGASPPGVPDGRGVSLPVTVDKADATGSSLSVFWDSLSCAQNGDHQIIYGEGSQLPLTPGGAYNLAGSACSIGAVAPFTWNPSPTAGDGTGLIWWLVVVNDGSGIEGSWGSDGVAERAGTGFDGSSSQCGVTDKNVTNTCGQ